MATQCPKCRSEILDDSRFCGRCGTQIRAAEEELPTFTQTLVTPTVGITVGSMLAGKYHILEEIGHGGMGIVYKAEDMKLKRMVALKFLPLGSSSSPEARERFVQEARAAAALSHPNICTIHEVDEKEGQPFIVMEYVEGDDLRHKVRRGPLSLEEALDIAIQAAEGLDKAHQKGIVHRDIKSANIMVADSGQAKIMDFGLAKLRGGSSLTGEGATIGTVAYMSPEQARGDKVDRRTDVWSLGVVLYEMLTGELPFRGERDVSLLYSIVHESPRSLRDKKPPVPAELQRVIERALDKDVRSRYQTAAEMKKDLARYREGLRAEAAGLFNARSLLRRLRRPAIAVPSVLALTVVVVFGAWFIRRQAKIRFARYELLPKVVQLAQETTTLDYSGSQKVYQAAVEVEKSLPDDPKVAEIFKKFSTTLSVTTDPPGTRVSIKPYQAPDGPWEYLGVSPLGNIRLPLEYLRLKLEKEGYETVVAASSSWDDFKDYTWPPNKTSWKLDKVGDVPSGMVRVAGVEDQVVGKIGDFFMDRLEVTNKQYREFVNGGGYDNKKFWKNAFVKNGRPLTWEQAMAEFVDGTGRPGPSTWQGGGYPEGQDDYPVSGVSWYEAAAYAEFAHKSLPTAVHWGMAQGQGTPLFKVVGFMEYFGPQCNFKGKGPERVGSNPAISAYGLYDMGGNVREWCWNETQQGRLVRGGAWNDVPYMFEDSSQVPPFDRSAKNGFRCAIYIDPERIPRSSFAPVKALEAPDFSKQSPVTDEVFRIYRDQFSYDKSDLNARIEWRDETSSEWIQERVSFDAAYDNERVFAYLFLPKNGFPPFQTVIYFPTGWATGVRSSKDIDKSDEFMPFILKNRRALLFPIYKGAYERGNDATLNAMIQGSRQMTELVVKIGKDLRRSVDYLETRSDIDVGKLAYVGHSWGAALGPIMTAVEDRFKASVLRSGGFYVPPLRPEIDQLNYVSRVKIPTLMLNGRYDFYFNFETCGRTMFDLLGTPREQKELKVYDTDHTTPDSEFIKETLRWLDKYLGPVKSNIRTEEQGRR
jgi:serine/threonine protein kinase/predicted esterase